ncbi:hypothetical protein BLAHAN_04513 [Blautia hansenii DSM 20583]|uniref:Uncharacterized protein n=1 Tax=Blautia hansenii DSM 20583 TaxID=537007 RepID=C9L563_BLAHA|nr:hypothetical protein BLAHAN_04513 [Blautia hansenii DSM 20583]
MTKCCANDNIYPRKSTNCTTNQENETNLQRNSANVKERRGNDEFS